MTSNKPTEKTFTFVYDTFKQDPFWKAQGKLDRGKTMHLTNAASVFTSCFPLQGHYIIYLLYLLFPSIRSRVKVNHLSPHLTSTLPAFLTTQGMILFYLWWSTCIAIVLSLMSMFCRFPQLFACIALECQPGSGLAQKGCGLSAKT